MAILTDAKEFLQNGLGQARNFADGFKDVQTEWALLQETIDSIDPDSGTYVVSDETREGEMAAAGFFDGDDLFGMPPIAVLAGASLLIFLVLKGAK